MQITETLYVTDREAWRAWLEAHYRTKKEVWLVYYRKATGRPRIAYNDAVEEALCFGWIDSTAKSLDAERTAQRFTPRRRGSPYSQPNRERLRRMAEAGRVAPDVLPHAAAVLAEPFVAPDDVVQALRANERAWAHFERFSASYQRIRLAFVDAARSRPEEFEKRLRHLVRMTEQGKQFGFGIETYF